MYFSAKNARDALRRALWLHDGAAVRNALAEGSDPNERWELPANRVERHANDTVPVPVLTWAIRTEPSPATMEALIEGGARIELGGSGHGDPWRAALLSKNPVLLERFITLCPEVRRADVRSSARGHPWYHAITTGHGHRVLRWIKQGGCGRLILDEGGKSVVNAAVAAGDRSVPLLRALQSVSPHPGFLDAVVLQICHWLRGNHHPLLGPRKAYRLLSWAFRNGGGAPDRYDESGRSDLIDCLSGCRWSGRGPLVQWLQRYESGLRVTELDSLYLRAQYWLQCGMMKHVGQRLAHRSTQQERTQTCKTWLCGMAHGLVLAAYGGSVGEVTLNRRVARLLDRSLRDEDGNSLLHHVFLALEDRRDLQTPTLLSDPARRRLMAGVVFALERWGYSPWQPNAAGQTPASLAFAVFPPVTTRWKAHQVSASWQASLPPARARAKTHRL